MLREIEQSIRDRVVVMFKTYNRWGLTIIIIYLVLAFFTFGSLANGNQIMFAVNPIVGFFVGAFIVGPAGYVAGMIISYSLFRELPFFLNFFVLFLPAVAIALNFIFYYRVGVLLEKGFNKLKY